MKKQTLITSFFVLVMLIATFSSITALIDGDITDNKSEENKTETNDLTSALEEVLPDPDSASVEELIAANELIQNELMGKLAEPVQGGLGSGIYCGILRFAKDQAAFFFEYYTMFRSTYLGNYCSKNDCSVIDEAIAALGEFADILSEMYNEECLGDGGQSVPVSEGCTSMETASSPLSQGATQQANQDRSDEGLIG